MQNPLDIEQQYQALRAALAQPAVSWHRAGRIIAFLDSLGSGAHRYESYVLDALDHLYPILRNVRTVSLSPEELQHPLDILNAMATAAPGAANDERFDAARAFLRNALLRAWSYVGDLRAMVNVLGTEEARRNSAALERFPEELLADRRARLNHLVPRLSFGDPGTLKEVQALLEEWHSSPAEDLAIVRVPVIERGFGDLPVESRGLVRTIALRIVGDGGPGGDRLEATLPVYGAETIGANLVRAPIAAARRVLNATAPRLKRRTFAGIVTLDQHPALYEADSAGLGIAALFTVAVLRYAHERVTYRLRPEVAMTGIVDADGTVSAVNPASLIPKVRAVFFSRVESLVVPQGQLGPVLEEATRLRLRYPGRPLEIIGVSHLREIFYDLRVIRHHVVPRGLQFLHRAWRRREASAPPIPVP